MDSKAILGYAISVLGLIALASTSFPQLKAVLAIPAVITDIYLTIGSIVILAVGVFLILKNSDSSSSNKLVEVPIYHGEGKHRKIVGYQRIKQ